MSQRYYFDLESQYEILRDGTGVDADDPEGVLGEARSVISELVDAWAGASPDEAWRLIVRDAAGMVVGCLPICG